jgi:YidC/Oxa1 family membrane protein insertase
MEIRRTILIAAIAVVTYLIFITWQQQFSIENGKPQQAASAQHPQQSSKFSSVPSDNNLAVAGETPHLEDTEKARDNHSGDAKKTAPNKVIQGANKSADDNYIHVETDVLRLAIDPKGGDIVSLDLPAYPAHINTPGQPFTLLSDDASMVFEAQSGLIGPNGTDTSKGRPLYKSTSKNYQLKKGSDELTVDLVTRQAGGITIIKRYVFTRGRYLVKVENLVSNQSGKVWKGAFYGQLKRDDSKDPSLNGKGLSHMSTYLGGAYYSADGKYEKLKFDTIKEDSFNMHRKGGWIAFSQHYFLTAWIGGTNETNQYSAVSRQNQEGKEFYFLRFISPMKVVSSGQTAAFTSELYAGPKIERKLASISPDLGMTIDYGWSWFIAEPIFAVLVFLESGEFKLFGHHFNLGTGVGNWGVAIILLTVLIKLLFFRLSASSYHSMAKMRKVAPEMQRIKEQFKDDRQKQSAEMMKLYKREKINPIGGCLPMVIQAPVFIALYYVLLYSVELRQAPFFGWIKDLSVMDPYFILPIIMGVAMFFQMQLNPTPADNTQARLMKWMPVGFTVFFLWFPSGLVLYYVTNNILSIAQQYWITRKIHAI